jgi:preprotein translocase subunit Sec61beta
MRYTRAYKGITVAARMVVMVGLVMAVVVVLVAVAARRNAQRVL